MKLRRCPNLHYYDGDKYEQCPHCKAAMAQQAPKPEVKQEETPKQTQAPKQEETLKPQPAPVPEQVSQQVQTPVREEAQKQEEVFAPAKEETWRCECGAVNQGRFCQNCGRPKPAAETAVKKPVIESAGGETAVKGSVIESAGGETAVKGSVIESAGGETAVKESAIESAVGNEEERSLTAQLEEVSFTGNIEDAQVKAAHDDESGVTQVIFDDIDDGFVLAWLTVTNGSAKGKVYTITDPKCTVGRADTEHPVDIDIHNDRGISRGAQGVIVYDPLNKKFFLQTSGKTYIYINKEMVLTYKELAPYDIIRIGSTDLVFVPLCSEQFSW